ncbi:MAG: UvrD-helicase domain-containing protein [Pseudonocardiaceae bacterium]
MIGARLSLYRKAEEEIYKLERSVKAAFYDFCHRFRKDPDHPSLDLKPLKGHKEIFRAKVNQSWRALLVQAGVDAGTGMQHWLLIALRDRKDVYENLSVMINRVTGEIEFVDLGVVGDSVLRRAGLSLTPAEPEHGAIAPLPSPALPLHAPPLLAGISAEDLLSLGVAEALVPLALAVASGDELDRLIADAPLLSKDVLTGLAAGMSVEDVRAEITAPVQTDVGDSDDLAAALARTTVTTVDEDIRAVIEEGDFRAWKVFLHPTQRRIVERTYNGPARVSGGPGTGKTVVALHRVGHLVRQLPVGTDRPILLTTFTVNLAADLRARLAFLLEPAEIDRIDVVSIDKLAARVLSETSGPGLRRRRIDDSAALATLREVVSESGDVRWTPEFLFEEWDQVVLGQALETRRAYFEARRAGRGRTLTRPERNQVWKLLEQFTARLDSAGVETWGQAAEHAARFEIARARSLNDSEQPSDSGTRFRDYRYRHIVVDEAQDLRPAHWKMLRAMVEPGRDDMFIAGDTYQRIYDQRVTLSTVGINIRGRSSRLTLSYRTTRDILAVVTGIVAPGKIAYDDLDDGTEILDGYRSVLRGPTPELVASDTWRDELDLLTDALRRWRADIAAGPDGAARDPRGSIAVCVSDRSKAADVISYLTGDGLSCAELTKDGAIGDGEIHVGTMHRFKGLEYQRLAIVAACDGILPPSWVKRMQSEDPARFQIEDRKARSLLFVAATRARDTLRISWHGSRSLYLPDRLAWTK